MGSERYAKEARQFPFASFKQPFISAGHTVHLVEQMHTAFKLCEDMMAEATSKRHSIHLNSMEAVLHTDILYRY